MFKAVLEVQIKWLFMLVKEIKHLVFRTIHNVKQHLTNFLFSLPIFVWFHKKTQLLLIKILSVAQVPEHVSFIMDGNRRYAKSRNLPLNKGHEAGGVTLLTLAYICKKIGVKCVSAYAFSIENFNRSKEEVDTLMELFSAKLDEFAKRAIDYRDPLYGSRLKVVGDHSLISKELRDKIYKVEQLTTDGSDFTFYVCFPYTARNDIYHTMYNFIANPEPEKEKSEELTIEKFTSQMYLREFSNKCDLLIRTSGHNRFSDYMLWQTHENGTIEFCNTFWPDFGFMGMYMIILKWSFFKTIQKFNEMNFSLKTIWYEGPNSKIQNRYTKLEELPEPPVHVSVLGERE
ncbi:hypothetical protein NCAS_0F01440 [Naumovozyma castellii]|uniref:Alkyl transferase n=1 Tax=Naumovozyma castellii TaxID=27288 RepID=G0VGK7_NAUCA|nr:hypothetical protein NCAS_0F01440 [Naumovozyma castellii CBS 4309]CCC70628.1 hypothetical protein NCAS_0F01440 [Naumovozyma castellii CBS 4309]